MHANIVRRAQFMPPAYWKYTVASGEKKIFFVRLKARTSRGFHPLKELWNIVLC